MSAITQRQLQLLKHIVQSYIRMASPISSDHLVRHCGLPCSTATIRNEMAVLEDEGYLEQPHTSAGRIPTDEAYRFYVNALMRRERLTRHEAEMIEDAVNHQGDVSLILGEVSKIISQISNELGIVITPCLSHAVFDRLELIRLSGNKVLVVLHVISRAERTLILQVESALEDHDLKNTAEELNQRLNGLTLQEINGSIQERLRDAPRANQDILEKVLDSSNRLFDYAPPVNLHTSGTQMLINQPEFSDKKNLERFFSVIEDRNRLSSLFFNDLTPFKVVIGREHQDDELEPFSVVVASYRMGDDEGTIGVIGPKRMRYSKVLPLVERMARTMSSNLSS